MNTVTELCPGEGQTLAAALAGVSRSEVSHWIVVVVKDDAGTLVTSGCCDVMREVCPAVLADAGSNFSTTPKNGWLTFLSRRVRYRERIDP